MFLSVKSDLRAKDVQICEKQCRDENGFKCHTQAESHVRNALLVGEVSPCGPIKKLLRSLTQASGPSKAHLRLLESIPERLSATPTYEPCGESGANKPFLPELYCK